MRQRRPGGVLVVGSVNADLVVTVPRRPGPGETVLGSGLVTLPGGKGGNQAVAAARLGARAALVGRVGTDSFGPFLRAALDREGVATGQLRAAPGPSGVALVAVGPDGDNTIIVAPGANGLLTAADVEAAGPQAAAAAVICAQLEVPVAAVAAAAGLAAAAGARFILSLSPFTRLPPALLAAADPLVVNQHEAALALGLDRPGPRPGPREQAAALLAGGPRSVVITLGPDGAAVAGDGGIVTVPSPRVEVVDTTGAGDAFTGALAWRLAAGDTLASAAAVAARAGAAAVTGRGAQPSYPTRDQLPPA